MAGREGSVPCRPLAVRPPPTARFTHFLHPNLTLNLFSDRLAAHRVRPPVRGGQGLAAAYVPVPRGVGGKSGARAVEAAVIRALTVAGFPMLSVADGAGGGGAGAAAAAARAA